MRPRLALAFLGGLLLAGSVLPGPSRAADTDLRVKASVDGQALDLATERRPLSLRPERTVLVELEVSNPGSRAVEVRTVRLLGRVMGLTFFAYDTSVLLAVGPGRTEVLRFPLDLGGLEGQATGLLHAGVTLLDARRHPVGSEATVVDVRGSMRSVYGEFGVAVAVVAAVSLTTALLALFGGRLPDNRWHRALRFLVPGVATGLVLVFTLSATRVFVPGPGRWVPIVGGSSLAFFLVGYLTPPPTATGEDTRDLPDPVPAGS